MKKLIVFSVIFALLAPAVFAADLGVSVFGAVQLLQGDDGDDITGGGEMTRFRIEGSGENGDGTFGAWYRFEPAGYSWDGSFSSGVQGLAWWKPIDQFKLSIGGNADGIHGKEGVTGWMFNQMPNDIDVALGGDQVWGGGYGYNTTGTNFRNAFFGGFGGQGLLLDINPIDVLGINLIVPYIDLADNEVGDIIKGTIAQIDLNLDFGNIALTIDGFDFDAAKIFAYLGLTAIDNVGLDVSLGIDTSEGAPIHAGFGVKVGISDEFGLKARAVAGFGGDDKAFKLIGNVLPYYAISDNLVAFFNLGLSMQSFDNDDDAIVGFIVNPYLQVGAEWGPTFYAGFSLYSNGDKNADDATVIHWAVPIGIQVSF